MISGYDELRTYYGDLHSHCSVSYGHGSLEEAYQNACAQLDFASVTAHAHWPDMPPQEGQLAPVVAYHKDGFRRAADSWSHYREVTEDFHQDGKFVTFPSWEWHSLRYGDHNVYFRHGQGAIVHAPNLMEIRQWLRRLAAQGQDCFLIPHHIGYRRGYRGISWEDFTPEFSPVVEIFSMHGLAEASEGPYPYLHTMGPRDGRSTMQYGLGKRKKFGIIGSTDHHSAHPGSYGNGRAGVWAKELSRDGIWAAIAARRTYALTGDRIMLAFSVNGRPMGSILRAGRERSLEVAVVGGGPLDYVEVIHNNRPLHRWNPKNDEMALTDAPVKVHIEIGWGEKKTPVDWQVQLTVEGGYLLSVEPRFRGRDVVAPEAQGEQLFAFSTWERVGEQGLGFSTRTWGNPTTVTPGTQGVCLEIEGDRSSEILGRINGQDVKVTLGELVSGSYVGYLGGFLSPAFCFHQLVTKANYRLHGSFAHSSASQREDWYYVRLRQKNGQWAWSSPIWVEAA